MSEPLDPGEFWLIIQTESLPAVSLEYVTDPHCGYGFREKSAKTILDSQRRGG